MNAPALRARTCAIVVGVVGFAVGFLVSAARAAEPDHTSVATGSSGAPATADAAATPAVNTAIVPQLNPRFASRHAEFVEIAKKGDIDVLFMGDSITDWWRSAGRPGSTPGPETPYAGKPVFEKYFGEWKVANFGIAGDTTQGVLYRLQNGEGTGFQPKVVMLMIGTNNASRNTAPEIAEGVTAVVTELRKDFPAARILLLGIFPRATPDSPLRAKLAEVNATIAKLNDNAHVFYRDIGEKFLAPDGTIPKSVMSDGLHPTTHGYEIWAEAVKEPLTKLLTLAAR
jgi:lysophospholipase L1-like esterase